MKVNFNNLRKQAIYRYNALCKELNEHTGLSKGEWIKGFGKGTPQTIIINADQIQEYMDDLRTLIGSIACVFEDGEENFKDVYDEIYPEVSGERMEEFNPEFED